MKIVARVKRVLKGDSPIALLHGVTEDGHEVKLEVERHQTEGIERNAILVIDWYTYDLPALPDPPGENTEPTEAPTPTTSETPPSAAAAEPVEAPEQPVPERPPPQPEPAEPTSTAPDPAASTESAPAPTPPAERNMTLPNAGTTPDPRRRRNAQPDASAGATVDARLRQMLKIPR